MGGNAIDIDVSKIKIGALFFVSLLLAAFSGYRFVAALAEPQGPQIFFAALIAVLWMVMITLQPFFIKSSRLGFVLVAVEAVSIWVLFPDRFSSFTSGASVLLFVFLLFAYLNGRNEISQRLKISFWKVSGRSAKAALTGFALFIAVYSIGFLGYPDLNLSKKTFSYFLVGSEPLVGYVLPGFSLKMPIGDFLKTVAMSRLPEGAPQSVINETAALLQAQISKNLGIALSSAESLTDLLYKLSINKVLNLPPTWKMVAFIGIGLFIFWLVKAAGFFVSWVVVGIAFVVYEALYAFGFMHISFESRDKEVIIVD